MTDLENLVRFLPWDSEFFGRRIAKVLPSSLRNEEIQVLDAWSKRERIDCLYFLSADSGGPALWSVEKSGFHLVDLRVTLFAKLDKLVLPASESDSICLASSADIPDLRAIAALNHGDSRFYADPHFERAKCNELYAIWVEKSVKDTDHKVFIYKPEAKALGYVSSCLEDGGSAIIGLVGIAKDCQGRGIATQLTNHCIRVMQSEGCTQIQVVTQGRNIKAIQLYEKCGFRLKSIQTWFHKWYE